MLQMTQNMFQEGLYHVFFKETPSPRPLAQVTNQGELVNVRFHRWFGTVVSTRLLVTGVRRLLHVLVPVLSSLSCACFIAVCVSPQVVQILSAMACIFATVTHACVSYSCSLVLSTPVWSSLSVSPHLSLQICTQCTRRD